MKHLAMVICCVLALSACHRNELPHKEASVFGAVTPLRVMSWSSECAVPLVLEMKPRELQPPYWRLECREDLGGEPTLTMAPTVHGVGAVQQGWAVSTDEQLRIWAVSVIAPPQRFHDRAAAVIRTILPPALRWDAAQALELPPMPDNGVRSLEMSIQPEPHQHVPLMQRFYAGEVFSTSCITWSVPPFMFIP